MSFSKQETFDTVVKHLYKQGQRSMQWSTDRRGNRRLACAYRGKNNTSCAIGCLLPDEMINDSNNTGTGILRLDPTIIKYLGEENIVLLIQLQKAHDTVASWQDGYRNPSPALKVTLMDIASTFKLDAAVLKTV